MQKKPVKEHFEAHAEDWIASSYQGDGFTYPTAHHRARIVSRCLSEKKPPGSDGLLVADLGCGGGNLAIELAHQGHQVDGVDQAEKMIAIATQAKKTCPPNDRTTSPSPMANWRPMAWPRKLTMPWFPWA